MTRYFWTKLLKYRSWTDVEYIGSAKEEDRQFALLQEVFEAFPYIPINIDIKINDDRLIEKVSNLIKQYNREEFTVWGNFSDEVTQKCYKMVCLYANLLNPAKFSPELMHL